jgi:hypothetical protein
MYIDVDSKLWLVQRPNQIKTSIDEGKTWQPVAEAPGPFMRSLKKIGNTLVAVSGNAVFRTEIGSPTWETVYQGSDDLTVHDATMLDNGDMYISLYEFKILVRKNGEADWTVTELLDDKGIRVNSSPDRIVSLGDRAVVGSYWTTTWYKDSGSSSWNRSGGSFGAPDLSGLGIGVTNLYAKSSAEVYALVQDQFTNRGWAKSTDGGVTFNPIPFSFNDWVRTRASQLVAHGNSHLYMNVTDWGFLFSPDNGATWTTFNNGVNNFKPFNAWRMMEDADKKWWVLLSTAGTSPGPGPTWGVMSSVDKGVTWVQEDIGHPWYLKSLEDMVVRSNGQVVTAPYETDYFYILNKGSHTWSRVKKQRANYFPETDFTTMFKIVEENGKLYGATYWDNIMTSEDGAAWTELRIANNRGVLDFHVSRDTIYAISADQTAYHGIYKSIDDGTSWTPVPGGGSSFRKITRYDTIVFTAALDNKVFETRDDGLNWKTLSIPGTQAINCLKVLRLPSGGQFGGRHPYLLAGTNTGVYINRVGGNTWKRITTGNIYSISDITSTGEIFIGGANGYYVFKENEILQVRLKQTVNFPAMEEINITRGWFTLNATSSSGLPVTFTSSDTSIATINGADITLLAGGTIQVTATQAGDEQYEPASAVQPLVIIDNRPPGENPPGENPPGENPPVVVPVNQTITFTMADSLFVDESPYTLKATSTSGMAVTFEIVAGNGTISNNVLTFSAPGSISVKASQNGNANFHPAGIVTRTVLIKPLRVLSGKVLGGPNDTFVSGTVQLLKPDGAVIEQTPLTASLYSFKSKPDGDYYLKFIPASPGFFPTYYKSSINFGKADKITVRGPLTNVNWSALPIAIPQRTGDAVISGAVFSNPDAGRTTTTVTNGRVNAGTPVKFVVVYLLSIPDNTIINAALTNESGQFSMVGIKPATYQFLVDVPGVKMDEASSKLTIGVSETMLITSVVGKNSIVTTVNLVTAVEDEAAFRVRVYPNPASDHLYVESDEEVSITMLNAVGAVIKKEVFNGKLLINLANESSGLYFLKVGNSGGDSGRVIKIIKN